MNLNKEFLNEVISYLINRGVTLTDLLDTFNEHFNTLDSFSDSLKNMPTEIKRGTINNVIEEPLLPKYTMTESDKVRLESVSLSPETLNKVFETSKENPAPLKVSLSPNVRDYPTSIIPRGKGMSKARKMLFEVVEGKTVLEHLKANNIDYKLFDTRIRKNWTMEKACTTPLTRVVQPYTKSKKPVEKADPVIIPENIKVVEESSPKTKMMLVNGKMTELEVSDTDLVQSSIEKPAETLETESNTEKATENVTNATELKGNNVTAVILDTPNLDAIRKDKDDNIEKALKKFVTHSEEFKKDKKPKEPKKDYTVADVCFKLNVTTHELREMVSAGDFPQPDRGNKWSAKLLKEKGII